MVNMNTSSAAAMPSQPHNAKLLKLVNALKDCGELRYFNHVSKSFNFQNAGRWNTLESRVQQDISSQDQAKATCTVDSLEKVLDIVITRANHTYSISQLSVQEAKDIRLAVMQINHNQQTSKAAQLYPSKIEFIVGQTYPEDFALCKVSDMGDGFAIIFSSILMQKPLAGLTQYSQAFHTVFIPHHENRIEFRVSNSVGLRQVKTEMPRLKRAFINEVNLRGNITNFLPVNFFNVIGSLYYDTNEGRVSYAKVSTYEESGDLVSNGNSDRMYCSRKEITQTTNANGFTYHPRFVKVRYEYSHLSKDEMELVLAPHRLEWEASNCDLVSISEPKDSLTLSATITKILSRV